MAGVKEFLKGILRGEFKLQSKETEQDPVPTLDNDTVKSLAVVLHCAMEKDYTDPKFLTALEQLQDAPDTYVKMLKEAVDKTLREGQGDQYKALDFYRKILDNTTGQSPFVQEVFDAYKDLLILTGNTGYSTIEEFRAFQEKQDSRAELVS